MDECFSSCGAEEGVGRRFEDMVDVHGREGGMNDDA